MLKLHRLKIERFRSVKPCELYFNDGLNILLGRNGSGKTTLLKLITALYTSPIGEILPGEEYELEVEFRFLFGSVVTYIKRTFAEPTLLTEVDLGTMEDSSKFELKICVNFEPLLQIEAKFPHPEHHANWLVTRNQETTKHSLDYLRRPIINLFQAFLDEQPPFDFIGQPRMELAVSLSNAAFPFRFDESLGALDVINKRKIILSAWKHEDLYLPFTEGPLPEGYLEIVKESIREDRTRSSLIVDDKRLKFLKQFTELTGLQSARLVCERVEKSRPAGNGGATRSLFSNFRFSFTRRDGSEFWQDQLSYGQKRLLVFLYYISAIPQVIIADELVNGLHHEWIEACVQAMRGKQAFLTSQNPLLLDHLPFENQEEVRKTFLLCSATPQASGDVTQWKNMSETEAEIFYQAYKVGIQHVSEILHSEGLW